MHSVKKTLQKLLRMISFQCVLSLLYLAVGDLFFLINYSSFVESSFILLSVAGLLYMRWKRPDLDRPIKVSVGIPIVFLLICAFLVLMPLYSDPVQVGGGLVVTAIGIPFYFIGIYWRNKPPGFRRFLSKQ